MGNIRKRIFAITLIFIVMVSNVSIFAKNSVTVSSQTIYRVDSSEIKDIYFSQKERGIGLSI